MKPSKYQEWLATGTLVVSGVNHFYVVMPEQTNQTLRKALNIENPPGLTTPPTLWHSNLQMFILGILFTVQHKLYIFDIFSGNNSTTITHIFSMI